MFSTYCTIFLQLCNHDIVASHKKLNGWAEVGHWLAANFTFPAVTWKNIFWSFSMPLWCNNLLPGQSASIHSFEFFAVLLVWLGWGQICNFWLFSVSLAFFMLEKGQMKFVFFGRFWPIRFFMPIWQILSDFWTILSDFWTLADF